MPIKINGATSGSTTITAPDAGSDETIELSTALAEKLPYSYGTATPSTTDSGFLWYDSNSTPAVPKYWNGSSFATLAPAPGLELITTETFSAVSSVSVNGCFSATYQNYQIIAFGNSSNNADMQFRLRVSGTDDTGSNYVRQILQAAGTSVSAASTTDTSGLGGLTGTDRWGLAWDLNDPFATSKTSILVFGGRYGNALQVTSIGHSQSTSYDGITVFPSTGTFSGTLRVYGYKD